MASYDHPSQLSPWLVLPKESWPGRLSALRKIFQERAAEKACSSPHMQRHGLAQNLLHAGPGAGAWHRHIRRLAANSVKGLFCYATPI
jgi:hypothetical protein